jgi:hypothetical protein
MVRHASGTAEGRRVAAPDDNAEKNSCRARIALPSRVYQYLPRVGAILLHAKAVNLQSNKARSGVVGRVPGLLVHRPPPQRNLLGCHGIRRK